MDKGFLMTENDKIVKYKVVILNASWTFGYVNIRVAACSVGGTLEAQGLGKGPGPSLVKGLHASSLGTMADWEY